MSLKGTRELLKDWGRWGFAIHLGLPTRCPMFGNRALKTPLYGEGEGDPTLMLADRIVCRLEQQHRLTLIERYQWRSPVRELIAKKGWSKSRYFRELESAQWAFHVELENLGPICYTDIQARHSVGIPLT